jgi:hypothetical protein
MTKDDCLQQFLDMTQPPLHLWRSVRFVGYAAKVMNVWVLLGGQIVLSGDDVQQETLIKIAEFPDFLAFVDVFPIAHFSRVLKDIVATEGIHMNWGGPVFRDIRFRQNEQHDQLTWYRPVPLSRSEASRFGAGQRTGFQWTIQNSFQIPQLGASECLQRANESIRRDTSFNGFDLQAVLLMCWINHIEQSAVGVVYGNGDRDLLA